MKPKKRKALKVDPDKLSDEAQRANREVWYYEEPQGLCVVDYILHNRVLADPKSKPCFAYLPWRMLVASVERYKKAIELPKRKAKP